MTLFQSSAWLTDGLSTQFRRLFGENVLYVASFSFRLILSITVIRVFCYCFDKRHVHTFKPLKFILLFDATTGKRIFLEQFFVCDIRGRPAFFNT